MNPRDVAGNAEEEEELKFLIEKLGLEQVGNTEIILVWTSFLAVLAFVKCLWTRRVLCVGCCLFEKKKNMRLLVPGFGQICVFLCLFY